MIKKTISMIAVILMSLGFCCGCGDKAEPLPYNTVIVARGESTSDIVPPQEYSPFTDDFWKENLVSGIGYVNENWDPNDENSRPYKEYSDMPDRRIVIIASQEEYDLNF